jgi:hypothetical protein
MVAAAGGVRGVSAPLVMTEKQLRYRQTPLARTQQALDQVMAQLTAAGAAIESDCNERIEAAQDHAILLQDLGRRVGILVHRGRVEEAAHVAANASHIARLASQLLTQAIERRAAAHQLLDAVEPAKAIAAKIAR